MKYKENDRGGGTVFGKRKADGIYRCGACHYHDNISRDFLSISVSSAVVACDSQPFCLVVLILPIKTIIILPKQKRVEAAYEHQ